MVNYCSLILGTIIIETWWFVKGNRKNRSTRWWNEHKIKSGCEIFRLSPRRYKIEWKIYWADKWIGKWNFKTINFVKTISSGCMWCWKQRVITFAGQFVVINWREKKRRELNPRGN